MQTAENNQGSNAVQEDEETISTFLATNDKLLAALGGFVALSLFASVMPIKSIGAVLSVVFFACTVLIWLELWKKFPKKGDSRLSLFENLLSLATLLMVVHLVLDVNHYLPQFIMTFVFVGVLTPIGSLIKRFDLFNRVTRSKPGDKPTLRYGFGILLTATILLLSAYVTVLVSRPISHLLEAFYISASKPSAVNELRELFRFEKPQQPKPPVPAK